jgi:hypothetical protein
MMYKCDDCKLEFEEPLAMWETVGEYWGIPAKEKIYICPYCENMDFEKMEEE